MRNCLIIPFLHVLILGNCLVIKVDTVPEPQQKNAKIVVSQDENGLINVRNPQQESERRKIAAKDGVKSGNKKTVKAELPPLKALQEVRQDRIRVAVAEQERLKAVNKSKLDSINVAIAIIEKQKAIKEAKEAQEKLRIVMSATTGALIFILLLLGFAIIYRHKKKKMTKKRMSQKEPIVGQEGEKMVDGMGGMISDTPPTKEAISSDTSGSIGCDLEYATESLPESAIPPTSSASYIKWIVVGASVKGYGHIQSNMPCQDNNLFESLGHGWGIAIVSDGAGSAAHSELGSKIVVSRGIFHFKNLIEKEGWIEKKALPSDIEWFQKSYAVLKDLRNDVMMVAKKNHTEVKSLSATCLVVIYSPFGLLTVHIGDGRMGYKSMSGEWKSMMTPHKGDEANQTIFLVSNFWSIPNYEMSGVLVPESRVIREKVKAFALMSDGCENTAWLCSALNSETGRYSDRNLPFDGFFNPLEETLLTFDKENIPEEERQTKWYKFIESGTGGFVKEQDDKTMIYALNIDLVK